MLRYVGLSGGYVKVFPVSKMSNREEYFPCELDSIASSSPPSSGLSLESAIHKYSTDSGAHISDSTVLYLHHVAGEDSWMAHSMPAAVAEPPSQGPASCQGAKPEPSSWASRGCDFPWRKPPDQSLTLPACRATLEWMCVVLFSRSRQAPKLLGCWPEISDRYERRRARAVFTRVELEITVYPFGAGGKQFLRSVGVHQEPSTCPPERYSPSLCLGPCLSGIFSSLRFGFAKSPMCFQPRVARTTWTSRVCRLWA